MESDFANVKLTKQVEKPTFKSFFSCVHSYLLLRKVQDLEMFHFQYSRMSWAHARKTKYRLFNFQRNNQNTF